MPEIGIEGAPGPAKTSGKSLKKVMAWAKKNPLLAGGIVILVGILAYLMIKNAPGSRGSREDDWEFDKADLGEGISFGGGDEDLEPAYTVSEPLSGGFYNLPPYDPGSYVQSDSWMPTDQLTGITTTLDPGLEPLPSWRWKYERESGTDLSVAVDRYAEQQRALEQRRYRITPSSGSVSEDRSSTPDAGRWPGFVRRIVTAPEQRRQYGSYFPDPSPSENVFNLGTSGIPALQTPRYREPYRPTEPTPSYSGVGH